MKRYFLFCYQDYYPRGGWEDFEKDFNTPEEAAEHGAQMIEKHGQDAFHVIDSTTGQQRASGSRVKAISLKGYQYGISAESGISIGK